MKKKSIFLFFVVMLTFIFNVVYAGGGTFLNTDFDDTDYSNKHLKVISLKEKGNISKFYTLYTDGTVEYYDLNENNDIVNNQTYYFSYDEVCRINQPFLKRTRIEFFGDTVPSIPINTDLAFEITCYSEEGLPIIVFDTLKSIEELNALEQLTKSPIISNDILNINLSDIKNTKYENAVSFLVRKNVVSGFDDGTYKPNENVTRAQLTKMIAVALDLKSRNDEYGIKLTDIDNHWAQSYIKLGIENGIIAGYDDGSFKPDKNVTYAECMTMLIRALDLEKTLIDIKWPNSYLSEAYTIGLLRGIETDDNNNSINRGNTAIAVYNMMQYKNNTPTVQHRIEEITKDLVEVPSGEILKLSQKLPINKSFQLKTINNNYNACYYKENHIGINQKGNDGKTYMIFDLSLVDTNGFDVYGGFAYHYLIDYALEFDYEVIEYEDTLISEFNNELIPRKAILRYENYYKVFDISRNKIKDPNAEFVVNANEFGNFLAFIINNSEHIKIVNEETTTTNNNKNDENTDDEFNTISKETNNLVTKYVKGMSNVSKSEIKKMFNTLKNKETFILTTKNNIYNSCTNDGETIILGKEILDSRNLGEVSKSKFLTIKKDNNGVESDSTIVKYMQEFEYSVNYFGNVDSIHNQVVVLSYNNHYVRLNVTKNNNIYSINLDDFYNFLAYVINNNKNIKIITEKSSSHNITINKLANTKIIEKENYSKKINNSQERVYLVNTIINNKEYKIPQINFDNENANNNNKRIKEEIEKVINNNESDVKIDFEYHLSEGQDDILAVIIYVYNNEKVLDCFVHNYLMIGANAPSNLGLIKFKGIHTKDECVKMIKEAQGKLSKIFGEYNYNYGNTYVNEGDDGLILSTRMFYDENNILHLLIRNPLNNEFIDSNLIDKWLKDNVK